MRDRAEWKRCHNPLALRKALSVARLGEMSQLESATIDEDSHDMSMLVSLDWSNYIEFICLDLSTNVGTCERACHDDSGDVLAP